MDVKNILAHCDHTLLKQESTWAQIKEVCDDGLKYGCASVCIPASFVKQAADYVGNELKICTVIGFPNGYSTTAVKVFETEDAIRNGADEIDMVINIGWVKDQRWDEVLAEIKAIKASCQGRILKVIVETCLLTEAEKYIGYPYVWGGSSPSTSFDCSGYLSWLLHRRRHPGGCGPVQGPHRPRREDQGRGRHLQPPGRRGLHGPGRGPPGHVPDRQAGEGRARRGILSGTERGTGPQGLASRFCFSNFITGGRFST